MKSCILEEIEGIINMDQVLICIQKEDDGKTIKDFLKSYHVGRGKIEEIRVHKLSFINNVYAPLDSLLQTGDNLSFLVNEKIDLPPNNTPLDILYEDDYLLIVNKPAGYLIHDDASGSIMTLSNLVAAYYYQQRIFRPVRYIHRLDVDTTGIVLFAKDFISESQLHFDMESHDIQREYIGLVHGLLDTKRMTIKTYMGRDRHDARKMRVSNKGQLAITKVKVLKEIGKDLSLVRFILKTGRTHQIRVHMSSIGHPLVGDGLYGIKDDGFKRVALHSYKITFKHPILKKIIIVTCPLPNDMEQLIKERKS